MNTDSLYYSQNIWAVVSGVFTLIPTHFLFQSSAKFEMTALKLKLVPRGDEAQAEVR